MWNVPGRMVPEQLEDRVERTVTPAVRDEIGRQVAWTVLQRAHESVGTLRSERADLDEPAK